MPSSIHLTVKCYILGTLTGEFSHGKLIIYTLITRNPAIDFLDSSFYKPGLVWLGFIGLFLFFATYLLFSIGTSISKFFPEKKQLVNITTISGLFLLLLAFILLFVSYDIEDRLLGYVGFILEASGVSMISLKELIQRNFENITKIWSLMAILILFIGLILLAY